MKKLMLSIALLGVFGMVHAQRQNTYFMKHGDQQVTERDSADYIRVIQEKDSGEVHYKVNEYFPDGTVKSTGFASGISPLVYEGDFISFNKKGTKICQVTYSKGTPIGIASYYYNNGTLENQIEHEYQPDAKKRKSKFMYYADSLGNVMVKDGNGHYLKKDPRDGKDEYVEEGDYKDGLMVGEWTLKSRSGSYWYKEQYELGKLIKGESFKDGVNYQYTEFGKQPEYPGSISAFYKYLSHEIRYPGDAAKARITGKVFLSFVVEKDGVVTDVKVDRGVYPSIDREALRVIRNSPKWIPGVQHGIPVRVKYNLPLSFNLQ